MKLQQLRKQLLATAVGGVLACGMSQAVAGPVNSLTVNPAVLGGPAGLKVADYMTITASELLHVTGMLGPIAAGHQASGVINVSGMYDSGPDALNVGLLTNYRLYMTFDLVDTFLSASAGPPAALNYAMTKLNVKFWADTQMDTTIGFVNNASAPVGTEASVGGNFNNDTLLAVADLVAGVGTLTNDANGAGASLKATLNFALCTAAGEAKIGGNPGGTLVTGNLAQLADGTVSTGLGSAAGCTSGAGNSYFTAPRPFYELAFSAFTNTGQNAVVNADGTVGVRNAGQLDFGRVPEPGTVALMGLGLFGIGALVRRRT